MIAEGLEKLAEIIRGNTTVGTLTITAPVGLPLPDGMDEVEVAVVTDASGKVQILDPAPYFRPYQDRPIRIVEQVELETAQSVIDYVERFDTRKTAMLCSAVGAPTLVAIIDHHGMSTTNPDTEVIDPGQAGWCQHTATYRFPVDRHFAAWQAASERCRAGKLYSQGEFAELLQDREVDIQTPPRDWGLLPADQLDRVLGALNLHDDIGAQTGAATALVPAGSEAPALLDPDGEPVPCETALAKLRRKRFGSATFMARLALGIEASVGLKFKQTTDLKTGDRSFSFEQTGSVQTKAGRQVNVPDYFLLYVPVFEQAERALLPVRLFYRIRGEEILWGVELMDVARLVRDEVTKVAQSISDETGVPLFFGKRV